MKAFVLTHPGAADIELADVALPKIAADELLVRVHAIGVGIHDSYFLPPDAAYPYPIGIEAAGVIESVGGEVQDRRPGDRIAFVSAMQPKGGTWAEYVAVAASSLILDIPADLDFVRAAAIPVAGNTVLRALTALPRVETPGDRSLFVAGGSGAIGTFAVQLAHHRGWRIAASASPVNHDYLLSLGAAKAVDYRSPHWPEQVREWAPDGVDAAIAVQPDTSSGCLPVVKDGGLLMSISGDDLISERGITPTGIPYGADVTNELARLMEQITTGEVRLELERVYPFGDALDALAKVRTRRARGKLVIQGV